MDGYVVGLLILVSVTITAVLARGLMLGRLQDAARDRLDWRTLAEDNSLSLGSSTRQVAELQSQLTLATQRIADLEASVSAMADQWKRAEEVGLATRTSIAASIALLDPTTDEARLEKAINVINLAKGPAKFLDLALPGAGTAVGILCSVTASRTKRTKADLQRARETELRRSLAAVSVAQAALAVDTANVASHAVATRLWRIITSEQGQLAVEVASDVGKFAAELFNTGAKEVSYTAFVKGLPLAEGARDALLRYRGELFGELNTVRAVRGAAAEALRALPDASDVAEVVSSAVGAAEALFDSL